MKTKLTMVSVGFRGTRKVIFIQASIDEKGRAHIPMQLIHDIATELGCPAGSTFISG